jgi:MFS family permease
VMIHCATGALLVLLCIIYLPIKSLLLMNILQAIEGVFAGAFILGYAVILEHLSRRVAGVAFAVSNILRLLIGAIVLQAIAVLLSEHWSGATSDNFEAYSILNFRISFVILPVCLSMAIIMGWLLYFPEVKPGHKKG